MKKILIGVTLTVLLSSTLFAAPSLLDLAMEEGMRKQGMRADYATNFENERRKNLSQEERKVEDLEKENRLKQRQRDAQREKERLKAEERAEKEKEAEKDTAWGKVKGLFD